MSVKIHTAEETCLSAAGERNYKNNTGLKGGLGEAQHHQIMMTSSNGNIFRVTGPLCGESTRDRWIPLTKRQ